MHPVKRRRLDAAAHTLNRPFRSPLHVHSRERKSCPPDEENNHNLQRKTSASPTSPSQVARPTAAPSPLPGNSPPRVTNRPQHHVRTPPGPRPLPSPLSTRSATHNAESTTTQKQHNTLLLQLKEVSAALDTAVQALQIIKSNKDSELDNLTLKWRTAARDAAETLFAAAKERVDGMGGIGSWRKSRIDSENRPPWDDTFDADDHKLTNDQKEQLRMAREDAQIEARKYGPPEPPKPPDVDDEDFFTIGTMLEQLNVDLKIIGYDIQEQQWAD